MSFVIRDAIDTSSHERLEGSIGDIVKRIELKNIFYDKLYLFNEFIK